MGTDVRLANPVSSSSKNVPTVSKRLHSLKLHFSERKTEFLSPCHYTSQHASVSQSYAVPFHQGHVHSCIYIEFHTTECSVSELMNSQGALLPVYTSTVDILQISQCYCYPSYKKRTYDINVFLTLTCKCTPTNVSNKSDVCVTTVYNTTDFGPDLGRKKLLSCGNKSGNVNHSS